MSKIKRIFTCKNGHSYESKEPITTSWAEENAPAVKPAKYLFGFIPISPPEIIFPYKANDKCNICGAVVIKEDDYVDGKLTMGGVRI